MSESNRPIMLAAGGTGGHLFPAFALAEELGRRNVPVELVTDMRGDRYGTDFPARRIHQVPSATLGGSSPVAVTKTAVTLSRGVWAAYRLLGEVRPSAIIGFGGYPSFPPLMAARMRRIPSALHEQNAVLGRANRMLAKRVDVIAASFATTKYLGDELVGKARLTGNPVRDVVVAAAQLAFSTPEPDKPFHLLVFGGSQGARYFSDVVPQALAHLPPAIRRRMLVVQQAREEDVTRVEAAYAAAGIRARIATFFADLPTIMAHSHLVIARAGASTIAELAVIGRPAILVPLPHALDNDQLQNATRLAEVGAAVCLEQKDITPERLAADIAELVREPAQLRAAANAAKAQGRADAVRRLADLMLELAARGAMSQDRGAA